MKNLKMVRDLSKSYLKKSLYSQDIKIIARFVNLYKDLFKDRAFYVYTYKDTNIGEVYTIEFRVLQKDFNDMQITLKQKAFTHVDPFFGSKYTLRGRFIQ